MKNVKNIIELTVRLKNIICTSDGIQLIFWYRMVQLMKKNIYIYIYSTGTVLDEMVYEVVTNASPRSIIT